MLSLFREPKAMNPKKIDFNELKKLIEEKQVDGDAFAFRGTNSFCLIVYSGIKMKGDYATGAFLVLGCDISLVFFADGEKKGMTKGVAEGEIIKKMVLERREDTQGEHFEIIQPAVICLRGSASLANKKAKIGFFQKLSRKLAYIIDDRRPPPNDFFHNLKDIRKEGFKEYGDVMEIRGGEADHKINESEASSGNGSKPDDSATRKRNVDIVRELSGEMPFLKKLEDLEGAGEAAVPA